MSRYIGVQFEGGNRTIYTYLANQVLSKRVLGKSIMVPVGPLGNQKEARIVADCDSDTKDATALEEKLRKQNLLHKLKSVSENDLIK